MNNIQIIMIFSPKPHFASKFVFNTVGIICKTWLRFNRVKLHNWEIIDTLMNQREFDMNLINKGVLDVRDIIHLDQRLHGHQPRQQSYNNNYYNNDITYPETLRPIITVSNHLSNLDDPIIWGNLDWHNLSSPSTMRWTLGASNILFTNPLYSFFFSIGKCIKTIRGNGIYQDAIDFSLDRISEGQWIHIFPEGRVNQSEKLLYFKWGVGRMVAESKVSPIILPIYHRGLEKSMPLGKMAIPRIFKDIEVFVGEPFDCQELHNQFKNDALIDVIDKDVNNVENDQRKKKYYKMITTRIEEKFTQLYLQHKK